MLLPRLLILEVKLNPLMVEVLLLEVVLVE